MAVPANLAACGQLLHIAHATRLYELCVQLSMTADAVVHDHLTRQCLGLDGLMFHAAYEICCMLHAVKRLETVIYGQVLMGHMTIVTGSTIRLMVNTSVR